MNLVFSAHKSFSKHTNFFSTDTPKQYVKGEYEKYNKLMYDTLPYER